MTKRKYKLNGRLAIIHKGILVWAYSWYEVDEKGDRIYENLYDYWVTDLFWRGLTNRPLGEKIPEHVKFQYDKVLVAV